ncbi:glycerate kinase [Aquibacillus rhizosphaerae]|uniref:Glycerate kinase n=1 Tax=Aquibacillus rhizosphaerae TaxID=3051431 RepID=A0ABT7L0Y9_9BACI|nr:glycerate kinase [Aquibacillus sp. LR5S19]MDL4839514.1 glycerate kinase [Aquibacillus sp. LR5S19]
MNIVVAPDSYKGSLTALEVASVMKRAINDLDKLHQVIVKPMADGGEGTIDTMLAATEGQRITITCTGPLGKKINTFYAVTNDETVIIEVANISGLVQVPEADRNPERTTTYGIGEVIKDGLEKGYRKFIIGLGGSATNDGGLGMLQALGLKANDQDGKAVGSFGSDLFNINHVNFKGIDKRMSDVDIRVACDVDNPLCGPYGSSAVYGPQKGATPNQVERFDDALQNYAFLVERELGKAYQTIHGAGAAGGLGFALLTLGGKLESGAELLGGAAGLEKVIRKSDLVITGEGQSDDQTLRGKAPAYVADLATKYNIPAVLISGSLSGDVNALRLKFAGCFSIINKPLALNQCIEQAEQLVYEQTKQVVNLAQCIKDLSNK